MFLLTPQTMASNTRRIYFGHITSFGDSGYNSSGAVPAVELAVEHINNNPSILPGYKLVSTPVQDSGVSFQIQLVTRVLHACFESHEVF